MCLQPCRGWRWQDAQVLINQSAARFFFPWLWRKTLFSFCVAMFSIMFALRLFCDLQHLEWCVATHAHNGQRHKLVKRNGVTQLFLLFGELAWKWKMDYTKKNAASVRAVFHMRLCTHLLPFLPEKSQKQSTIEFLAEARFVTLCKFQMIYPLINISWIWLYDFCRYFLPWPWTNWRATLEWNK